jgi:hypothetical protein
MRKLVSVGLAVALVLTFTGSAFAAKGGGGGGNGGGGNVTAPTASIILTSADPHLGGVATFAVSYTNNVKIPRVEVLCYQAGQLVYGEAGSPNYAFILGGGGSLWLSAGGAADCVANLYYFDNSGPTQTYVGLASWPFVAGPARG